LNRCFVHVKELLTIQKRGMMKTKQLITLIITAVLLTITGSTAAVMATPSAQVESTTPQLIIQLSPQAEMSGVVQLLADLQGAGLVKAIKPGLPDQLKVEAGNNAIPAIKQIPGVERVISLKTSSMPQASAQLVQSNKAIGVLYSLAIVFDNPSLFAELSNLMAKGTVIQFQRTTNPTILHVVGQANISEQLSALTGVQSVQVHPTNTINHPVTQLQVPATATSDPNGGPTTVPPPTGTPTPPPYPTDVWTPGDVEVITGTVTDEETNEPLANIQVCAVSEEIWNRWPSPPRSYGRAYTDSMQIEARQAGDTPVPTPTPGVYPPDWWWSPELLQCEITKTDGTYTIYDLPPDQSFYIAFSDPNRKYIQGYFDNQLDREQATKITLIAEEVSTINASLSTGGHITGTVTNAQTEPLSNITVELYTQHPNPNNVRWEWHKSTTTDENGNYELVGLNTNQYWLKFIDQTNLYYREYYDNASSFEQATPVNVTVNETTTGINVVLDRSGIISGTVTDENDKPLSAIAVEARPYQHDSNDATTHGSSYGWATTNENGHYQIKNLKSDENYLLYFYELAIPLYEDGLLPMPQPNQYIPEYYDNAQTAEEATPVYVASGSTTENINAKLALGGVISGKMTKSDDQAIPYAQVELKRLVNDEWVWSGQGYTNDMGEYQVSGLVDGTYRAIFNHWDQSGQIQLYYNQVTDFDNATDITVKVGQTITNINAIFTTPNGKITGTITNEANEPIPLINFGLYRQQNNSWQVIAVNNRTDSEGYYEITGLIEGTYRLSFNDYTGNYISQFYDNTASLETATDIEVISDQTTSNINAVLKTTGGISGQVTDQTNNAPLTGVEVCASPVGDVVVADTQNRQPPTTDVIWCSTTTDDGTYTISNLDTYTYVVQFYSPNEQYIGEYYNKKASWDEADQVAVKAGELTTNIDAALSKGSSISGNVVDAETNTPLPDVWVCANPTNTQWKRCVTTGIDGNYTISGVHPDDYVLHFWDTEKRYLPQYYNNKVNWNEADRVTVNFGDNVTDINAALSSGGHITGRVTNSQNEPLSNIAVEVYVSGEVEFEWRGWAYTDTDGKYDIGGLQPGQYQVGFFDWSQLYGLEYYDDATTRETATMVEVTANATTANIDAVLAQTGSISGQVIADDTSEPLTHVGVQVYQKQNDTWNIVNQGYTNEDGNYKVTGLHDGAYRVKFVNQFEFMQPEPMPPIGIDQFATESYASEFYNDALDLASATDINVTIGETTPNINASLAKGGHITGRISDSENNPKAHLTLELFQLNNTTQEWDWIAASHSNIDGFYDFGGLNSGTYRLGAFDWSDKQTHTYYPDAPDLASAEDIKVTVSETIGNINMVMVDPVDPLVSIEMGSGAVTYHPRTGQATVAQPVGNQTPIAITANNICADGQAEILLNDTSYRMTNNNNSFQTTIPGDDLTDKAILSLKTVCNDAPQSQQVGEVRLYLFDPSGVVSDAETNEPIEGAEVMLYTVPGWQPKTSASDDRENTCQSLLSKSSNTPWNQSAPTSLGVQVDPNITTTDPAVNPLATTADGKYGWDVGVGCWYVVVKADGYETATSPVVGIPPEVTDLNISLTPTGTNPPERDTVYLPMINQ